jgi:hypothetical protein
MENAMFETALFLLGQAFDLITGYIGPAFIDIVTCSKML